MKKKTLLKKIEELNKKVAELQEQVRELQSRPSQATIIKEVQQPPFITLPFTKPFIIDECPGGGNHEYPAVWFGTVPPPCNKCGAVQQNPYVVTYSSTQSAGDLGKSMDKFFEDMDRRKAVLSQTAYAKPKP